jgi:hypothetical protein
MKEADAGAGAGRISLLEAIEFVRNLENREQQAGLHSPDLTALDNKLGGVTQINTMARKSGYTVADFCGSPAARIPGSNVRPKKF